MRVIVNSDVKVSGKMVFCDNAEQSAKHNFTAFEIDALRNVYKQFLHTSMLMSEKENFICYRVRHFLSRRVSTQIVGADFSFFQNFHHGFFN